MEAVMLRIVDVSKKYKKTNVLNKLNLKVKQGQVIGIIGKSGTGKSTLLKCINRIEEVDEGTIIFEGENIKNIDLVSLRQKIGLVFQDYTLFEHLNVLENLTIAPIVVKNKNQIEIIEDAKKILQDVGLEDKIYNYPNELSGGQKQRLAIARTLLMEPRILLLDEPTSSLDKETKTEVLKLIMRLVEKGMTLIIVSHEEELISKACDKVFKLIDGNLVEI